MSRKVSKRAAAAAAVEAAMVAAAVRLEQQEQGRLAFFRRSLERNDYEIAALQDLHTTIQIARRHLVRSCHASLPQYYYHHPDDKEEDCLLLLDLGQGKIRLSADKEGLEDATNSTVKAADGAAGADPNLTNNNSKSLVSKLSPQAYHWSYDFLLRLQLRRQLLNRLMRRLQRMAVLMDASAATDNNSNNSNGNNNNNKGDAAAMAALVQPPLPPKYGDLRLYMDTREIQEFQQHWQRQEQARIQIELQRESFHAKQQQAAFELQELDAAEGVNNNNNPTSLNLNHATISHGPPEEAAEGATATAAAAATDDTAAGKQEEEAAEDMEVDDEIPTTKENISTGEMDVANGGDAAAESDTKIATTTTAASNIIETVDEKPPKAEAAVDIADVQDAAKDTTPMMAVASTADNVDHENPPTEKEQEQSDPAEGAPKESADESSDNNNKEQEQQPEQKPAAAIMPPPIAPVSSTKVAATVDDDDDEANVVADATDDDELEIDYEAYREYMNAYEKVIHPTTGQVQYTLLVDDDAHPFAAATNNNKTGKKNKKKNMPDFSTFILPGIGATTHRTMSTQEKEAEYERWSTALLARIPQQPTMAELGLEHQVFNVKQRRRRALQRRQELEEKLQAAAAAATATKEASATTTTTAAVTLPFISPGKKLRNKPVVQDDTNMNNDDDNAAAAAAAAAATASVSRGKELRNKQEKDDDSKKDVDDDEQDGGDSKKDNDDDDSKSDRDDDDDRMDVDVADNQDKEKEARDEKKDVVEVEGDVKDKQESEDEQEQDVSSDEEEELDDDNEESQETNIDVEESQETKADEEEDKDTEDIDSSPTKNAAASDEKPPAEEKQEDDDDDDKPPTSQKKRPIILAPTPSFYDQDLKRVRLVHAEIMRSSMADFARHKIKEATQEYNTALQVSSELFARQKQLYAQLHAFTADTRNDMAKMQNQYDVDLAVAKSQWNRRRVEFEQKKLQRLMPERNNPNYRPDGTPMTKMYETQQDPVRQIVASTVAHIVDTVDLIDTCQLQNDRFTEEFCPPPPNVDSALSKNGKVEASIRQEITNLGMQLRSSEEDRQRSWKRMLKTKAEYSGYFGPNVPITAAEGAPTSHPHYQQQQHHHHHPSTPLPNLHQSSRQSFPQEAVVSSHNLPSFAPARAPRHPVRRPSTAPSSSIAPAAHFSEAVAAAAAAAAAAGSDSKYSAARVRERHAPDGTVAPVTTPKKTKEGLYQRPAGRTRKGMEWDAVRGIWVPAEQQTTLVPLQPGDMMMAWQQQQQPPQG